ncbi:CoA transferase [Candidatus Binatia bacterium]|jgi:crotonobetainyl-CoA:carnitine CoA-transferase CaiB-like acyl-CoA transferase|nr:CoA transferase [Candidatus Binatia bacterium]
MEILNGIRVIEVTEWGFVPSCATVLADWGADVIKIEHPARGDSMRGLITSGMIPGAKGVNFFVEQLFRNKKSVGIDFTKPAGRDLLYKLVEKADVFVTSFLPEARERLQITYEDLKKINPKIIYARGHGQGQKGPDRNRGGYDGLSFWARGGVVDVLTPPGQPFIQQRPAFGDFTGGMFLAGGIAGALFHRERTGQGIEVDVSLLGEAVWILSPDIVAAMTYGFELPKGGQGGTPNPLVATYECGDGRHLVLMMLQVNRFWPIFAKAIGREDLLSDPRFNPDAERAKNGPALLAELREMFKSQPRAHWAALLNASECIWGPVQTPLEVVEDPQVKANGYILDVDHPEFGKVRVAASPVQFSNEPPRVRNHAPEIGADTETVLLEAGLSWEEIGPLKDDGVIS